MDSYHQEIRRQREEAETQYAQALTQLHEAQQNYNEPAGWYGKASANVRNLAGKIEAQRAEVKQALEHFQQRFADAGFVVDKAARQALTQKSEAETVQSELERAIDIQDRQRQESLIPTSEAGRSLMQMHANAWSAWSRLLRLRALDDHGLPLARAIARARSTGAGVQAGQPFSSHATASDEALQAVTDDLDRWAASLKKHRPPQRNAEDDPEVPNEAHLGPLRSDDLLGVVEVHQAKRALSAQDRQQAQVQREAQQVLKDTYMDRAA